MYTEEYCPSMVPWHYKQAKMTKKTDRHNLIAIRTGKTKHSYFTRIQSLNNASTLFTNDKQTKRENRWPFDLELLWTIANRSIGLKTVQLS